MYVSKIILVVVAIFVITGCAKGPEYPQEIKNLQKAVKENPNDQNSYRTLIKSLYEKEFFKDAIGFSEDLLKQNDKEYEGIMYAGLSNEKLNKWDEAEKYYKKLCVDFPETGEGYYRLAVLQYKMGDYKNSIENLIKAMAFLGTDTKTSIDIMNFLAGAYYYNKDTKKAYEILDKALEVDPFNKDILYNYGAWLLRDGKYNDAIQRLDKLIAQNPQEGSPYLRLGKAYYNLRELDKAENAFYNASRFDSTIKILADIVHVQEVESTYEKINTAIVKVYEKHNYKYGNKYIVRGIIENVGLETAERVSVIVYIYDKKNKIIAQKVYDSSPRNVRPEQTVFFSIDFPYSEDIDSVKIEPNWHKRSVSLYLK
jgi:tetratricopeptide (TPR) repeat protein